ncbi:UvrD-helicase domain-containing protein [Microvirga arsenatis]|uniref:DNA 3'-5' helicase II n=1 Tax=Microvirga arsenatis TaxID=2692265 RepID=A0ABW9YTM3_9HYPH|nr:UvrD-helicase domain-containing protein [Microvirga arsenatis]NBJ09430.1 UvrD-helicase domain-containing protein [Microvirga arsenatis]NBJ23712.1 UvrD-helicase domain-containing protein [Microvirga arsenatis]
MADADIDLLSVRLGSVTAPAGCGKTQLIASTLARCGDDKPVLVLTHTNAGVAALRSRLDRLGIPAKRYRLSTIDGWSMRLISAFPARSDIDPAVLMLQNPRNDYPVIRNAAHALLESGHVNDVLAATYSRIIVDEYQDCSVPQHCIVGYASTVLPTCVLGDPLQSIFGFKGVPMPDWDEHVRAHFPEVGVLSEPWRWIRAGTEHFGRWLLDVREKLLNRERIDLRNAPAEVTWVHLDGTDDEKLRLAAARTKGLSAEDRVLVIGYSTKPAAQQDIARRTPGAQAIEAVDLKDLTQFAGRLNLHHADALDVVATFAQSVMSNVGAADYIRRVDSLRRGTARLAASAAEQAGLNFVAAPSYSGVADVLVEIGKTPGVITYRSSMMRACLKALQMCHASGGSLSFHDAAVHVREQSRLLGRALPRRAVGSNLLLKGLEGEVAVILDADELDARHLYVSMTRGSTSLVICSRSQVLNPHVN